MNVPWDANYSQSLNQYLRGHTATKSNQIAIPFTGASLGRVGAILAPVLPLLQPPPNSLCLLKNLAVAPNAMALNFNALHSHLRVRGPSDRAEPDAHLSRRCQSITLDSKSTLLVNYLGKQSAAVRHSTVRLQCLIYIMYLKGAEQQRQEPPSHAF